MIREVGPQVLVTYDANGGYGHPDHIQAHRVTRCAARVAADRPPRPPAASAWGMARSWTAMPRSVLAGGISGRMRSAGFRAGSVADLPFGGADELVTTEVDGTGQRAAKVAAFRPHAPPRSRSRIPISRCPTWALGQRIGAREHYTLLACLRRPGAWASLARAGSVRGAVRGPGHGPGPGGG